jgi:DNA-3-methyladenine glycosylase II
VAARTRGCAIMRRIHQAAGAPALRRNPPGFLGLCRIVVFQQVSVASGTAIWARVQAGIAPFTAPAVLALTDEQMRALGLSGPKVRTLRAVAAAMAAGAIDLDTLGQTPDAAVREQLTALHGIGPWTADIFLMFNLGRADAFAAGDLALQESARIVMKLEERPNAQRLEEIAERWRPWRAIAALMLWDYYRVTKTAKGGAPV